MGPCERAFIGRDTQTDELRTAVARRVVVS